MSDPSTIYDRLVTELSTLLSSYQRLPNGYSIESNAIILMPKAYGIAFDGGELTNRQVGCRLSEAHTFTLSLVQQIGATENNTTAHDTVIKSLLDDMHSVYQYFDANNKLNGLAVDIKVGDLNGIEYVAVDATRHYKLTRPLRVEFFD